jgi:hypothetical protein
MSIEYFTYTCSCVSIDVTTVVQSSDTDANKWGLQNIEHAVKKNVFFPIIRIKMLCSFHIKDNLIIYKI